MIFSFLLLNVSFVGAVDQSSLSASVTSNTKSTISIPVTSTTLTRTLVVGTTGNDVTELQKALVREGYLKMPQGVAYGFFGNLTSQKLREYQKAKGIPVTGTLTPTTRAIILPTTTPIITPIPVPIITPVSIPCTSTTPPWIKVLSPNGGETYIPSQQIPVSWTSCNVPSNASLYFVLEASGHASSLNTTGATFNSSINDGNEIITLPPTSHFGQIGSYSQYGNNYKFTIVYQPFATGTSAIDVRDSSDNLFTINSNSSSAPIITTTPAQSLFGQNEATLNGTYNSNGSPITNIWFEYGITTSLGTVDNNYLNPGVTLSGSAPIGKTINGFIQGHTYYFKVCGSNSAGSSCGNILSFIQPSSSSSNCTPGSPKVIITSTDNEPDAIPSNTQNAALARFWIYPLCNVTL